MDTEIEALVGQWVHVRTGGETIYTGQPVDYYGRLVAADEAALYVEQLNGETAYLPLRGVRAVREMPAPPAERERLLRPADSDEAAHLPRAARKPPDDPGWLPRPAGRGRFSPGRLVPKRFRRGG